MREWTMEELTERIQKRQHIAERMVLRHKSNERTIRKRSRDTDEQKILDHLCKTKWDKAVKEGKIRYISKREWYYEFD